jgi:hypothetical protein
MTASGIASSVANGGADPMRHFGRQVKKARQARGWTIREVGRELGYDDAQVSRVETGTRPPTESFAKACDRVWPERNGWFLDYYTESREWLATPPWFRPWLPIEAAATDLRVWQNSVVPGLLQTEDYTRAIMSLEPGLTPEVAAERIAARMARQCYSDSTGGSCVEVSAPGAILVRDTTDRTGPVLAFRALAWHRFLSTLR